MWGDAMIIRNTARNSILAESCRKAGSFTARLKGLMGVRSLPVGSGLLLCPCNSIHMFFMKIPLDIIFIDSGNIVVHVIQHIRPWRISPLIRKAAAVIELPAGTIAESRTVPGDLLELLLD